MLRDQRMEGMLEGTAGVGHGAGRQSCLDRRENTEKNGTENIRSDLCQDFKDHVDESDCFTPLIINCVFYISLLTDFNSVPYVFRLNFLPSGQPLVY